MVENEELNERKVNRSIDSFTISGFLKVMAISPVLLGSIYAASRIGQHYLDQNYPKQNYLQQKNVLGGPLPELYIEHDGVRYFSRIDGKDIGELVKQAEVK